MQCSGSERSRVILQLPPLHVVPSGAIRVAMPETEVQAKILLRLTHQLEGPCTVRPSWEDKRNDRVTIAAHVLQGRPQSLI